MEFAIIAPLLFLFILGLVEFGRMVMVQQVLTNASREGARRAILENATALEIDDSIADYLTDASVSGVTVTVAPDSLTNLGFGNPVTVTVSVPYAQVSWVPVP
ncbi:MAG: TadE/TadG family type IV pilus assembly protein, partial [Planctomycetota bacterium]